MVDLNTILTSWPILFALFVLGTCIGSFLNVVIYRLPRDLSVSKPARSFCTTSGQTIPWYDNIPILSYLLLKGKSRFDGKPISIRYPIVETLTGLWFAAAWYVNSPHWVNAFLFIILGCFLIAATGTDIDFQIIPDEVSIGSCVTGLAVSAAWPALHQVSNHIASLSYAIIGAVLGYGIFWLVGVLGKMAFKKDAMGMGDMKLMAGIGAFLGWQAVIYVLVVASLLGSLVGVALVLMRKKEWGLRMAFGPYLAVAALIWMLGGSKLWYWYVEFLTRKPDEVIYQGFILWLK